VIDAKTNPEKPNRENVARDYHVTDEVMD